MDNADRAAEYQQRELDAAINAVRSSAGHASPGLAPHQCVDCGGEIPLDRLSAIPGATRCTSCQMDHDRRQGWGA